MHTLPLLAFDRSLRSYDVEGRLHVESCNISKATVNPYLGREIPNFQQLGLDASRIYMMLRDPVELEKAAESFRNLPVLEKHEYVNASTPKQDIVVGTTGSDITFDGTYLKGSLAVWTQDGVRLVESGQQRELSSAYRYRADMTPGRYQGVAYDGVMRDIIGNHVALVRKGRAGSDVVVADQSLTQDEKPMYKQHVLATVLRTYLIPKLAQDAKLDDALKAALGKVPTAAYAVQIPGLVAATTEAFTSMLAADANLDDLDLVFSRLVGDGLGLIGANDAAPMGAASEEEMEDDPDMPGKKRKKKIAADGGDPNAPKKPEGGAEKPAMDGITKTAFDAALLAERIAADARTAAAVTAAVAAQQALAVARETVKPLVGEVGVALDSAEKVYKFALEQQKVAIDGVDPSAYGAMVGMLVKQKTTVVPIARDTAIVKATHELHPNLRRIKHA